MKRLDSLANIKALFITPGTCYAYSFCWGYAATFYIEHTLGNVVGDFFSLALTHCSAIFLDDHHMIILIFDGSG